MLRPKRPEQIFLAIATYLNLAVLVILFAAENWAAELHWVATVLAYTPKHPFIFLLSCLLLWSATSRAWRLLAANLVGIVFFGVVMLGFNIPLGRVSSSNDHSLRIVTYNIHHGARGPKRVAEVIDKLDADIVCLQEANACGKWACPLLKIRKVLPNYHVFHYGQLVILSRFSFVYKKIHCMPSLYGATREFLEARIDFNGRPFTVFNVHFHSAAGKAKVGGRKVSLKRYVEAAAELRQTVLAKLLATVKSTNGAYAIVGDLNTPPLGRFYRAVLGKGLDAFRAAAWGFGYTYTSEVPLVRIDHIFTSPNVGVASCKTVCCDASDHRPVVADLVLGN